MRLSLIVSLVLCASCAAAPGAAPTLYQRMGGAPAIRQVVDVLIDRTAADPRTARSFKDTKIARVKEKLTEQLCELAGGPCKYTGDPMREVHKGLKITEAELNLMVQFLREALEASGVGEAEKNEVLRLLAPMKRDVVFG